MEIANTSDMKNAQSILAAAQRPLPGKEQQAALAPQSKKYDRVSISDEARQKLNHEAGAPAFTELSSLETYLQQNFSAYRNGSVCVSKSFLKKCMADPEKLAALEEHLKAVPGILEKTKNDLPKNTKLISCNISIDADGNMSTETLSTHVGFNASKQAAELSCAVCAADVAVIRTKLQQDLKELKAGGADEDTLAQVKRLIRKAEEKLRQLKRKETGNPVPDAASPAIFSPSVSAASAAFPSADTAQTAAQ